MKRVCYWQCERCYQMIREEEGHARYQVVATQEVARSVHFPPSQPRTLALCEPCYFLVDHLLRDREMIVTRPVPPDPVVEEATP